MTRATPWQPHDRGNDRLQEVACFSAILNQQPRSSADILPSHAIAQLSRCTDPMEELRSAWR